MNATKITIGLDLGDRKLRAISQSTTKSDEEDARFSVAADHERLGKRVNCPGPAQAGARP